MMIQLADPLERLKALSKYMEKFIDNGPGYPVSFTDFLIRKYKHIIPGTLEYARHQATHCYYCHAPLVDGKKDMSNLYRASIDHFLPQSKYGHTERFVICCQICNSNKADIHPMALVKKMATGEIQSLHNTSDKRRRRIAEAIRGISNDILWKTGPRIYFTVKKGSKK